MWIRVYMVSCYMLFCSLIFTKPCKYFQLNSPYFNRRSGIFSKIELDTVIPAKWRLKQDYIENFSPVTAYPVFIKPEWGQNASGIVRIDNAQSLNQWQQNQPTTIRYIMQQGASGRFEFEIFYIRDAQDNNQAAVLTITESRNNKSQYPINSINNPDTEYVDITDTLSQQQQQLIWQMMRQIGDFKIARVSVKTDNIETLLNGQFKVIEVNVFIPMPINLLDNRYSFLDIIKMSSKYMLALARVTKRRNKQLPEKPVFTKIMLYNRQNRFLNFINARL